MIAQNRVLSTKVMIDRMIAAAMATSATLIGKNTRRKNGMRKSTMTKR